jgi:hypothetical protein
MKSAITLLVEDISMALQPPNTTSCHAGYPATGCPASHLAQISENTKGSTQEIFLYWCKPKACVKAIPSCVNSSCTRIDATPYLTNLIIIFKVIIKKSQFSLVNVITKVPPPGPQSIEVPLKEDVVLNG